MSASAAIHLYTAMIGLYLQPISTASGNIGFGIALGGSIPMLISHPRMFGDCWRSTWIRWLAVWVAFSWLSLAWSSDPRFGVEQFRASRVLLWIPILWPLRRHWMWLTTAVLTGTTMLQLIQALQVSPLQWPRSRKFALGFGLTTPTQTGLWDAVSLSFLLLFAVMGGWLRTIAFLPLAVLSAAGLVWSATRASVIGIVTEMLVASGIVAWTDRKWLSRVLLRCMVGLVILGGVSIVTKSRLQNKLERAVLETQQTIAGDTPATAELRIAMWEMTWDGWKNYKFLGTGIGGIPGSIAVRSTVVFGKIPLNTVRQIHSTYLQVLAETGLVGATFFGGFVLFFFRDALRVVCVAPVRITALGACIVWFVAAAFDGYQQSGGFLTVGAICMALATMPTTEPDKVPLLTSTDH